MTPSLLKFKITELAEGPLKKGSTISYRLRIRGIPIRWQSVISAWSPPSSFEDTQVRGPYRQWIHQHLFHEHGNNTIMEDRVRYRVLGGSIIHALFVRKDLLNIFNYRTECMLNHFKAEGESSELWTTFPPQLKAHLLPKQFEATLYFARVSRFRACYVEPMYRGLFVHSLVLYYYAF